MITLTQPLDMTVASPGPRTSSPHPPDPPSELVAPILPKSYYANERTYISWVNASVLILALVTVLNSRSRCAVGGG